MPVKGKLTIHEKLAAQYLALGLTLTDAAESAGIDLTLLRRAVAHPLFEKEVDACKARAFPVLADRLAHQLEQVQEPALKKMTTLMEAESEPVQFQAAKDLLNRGPLAPKTGQGLQPSGGAPITLDAQALQAILAGAVNAGQHGIVSLFASLASREPVAPLDGPRDSALLSIDTYAASETTLPGPEPPTFLDIDLPDQETFPWG